MQRLVEIWDRWPARFRRTLAFVAIVVAIAIVMTVIDLAGTHAHTNDPQPAPPAAATGPAR